ncbi:HET-domain-containing protein [Thozetella sp. PMI_491]|nr:HET-domain-containing protein [Thozetella sp. PMI_491]
MIPQPQVTAVQGPLHAPPPSTVSVVVDGGFRYRKLELNQIRLLKVLPERMSIIKCDIIYESLDDPPPYTAISYAWGDAEDTQKIQIGGDKVSITTSLHGALKALRQQTEVLLWADSLCINQNDQDERSQQVQLMSAIYARAESVAIWLGPESDNSNLGLELLDNIAVLSHSLPRLKEYIKSPDRRQACAALVALFERDYWERLWVVQEVFNAKHICVYCGDLRLPWDVFKAVCEVFKQYESDLKPFFVTDWSDDERRLMSRHRLRYSHVLTRGGPGSFPDVESLIGKGDRSLLEVLYACRTKLAADPRDKVFAILGLLPKEIGEQFPPNYNLAVKDVYTGVVDYLLTTTQRLDVICEAVHYPLHVTPIRLPSWVPDWSHVPQREMLRRTYDFSADRDTKAEFRYLDDRGNPAENSGNVIEISAIRLGTILCRGIAVDLLHGLDDYLMAFLHWRALLLGNHDDDESDPDYTQLVKEAFCRTLCLGQVPKRYSAEKWARICYHIFASLIRERLKHLALDEELERYADGSTNLTSADRKRILDEACHHSMQGRSFCLTKNGLMGIGSGFMAVGDVVVVPLGCYTPIILRPDANKNKYRYAGDIYIDGYMYGRAVDEYDVGRRKLSKFVLY